jgi:Leucine-rich repeat (LRR) protein
MIKCNDLINNILIKSDIKTIIKISNTNKYWQNKTSDLYYLLCKRDFSDKIDLKKFNAKNYKELYKILYCLNKLKNKLNLNLELPRLYNSRSIDIDNNIPNELICLPKLDSINIKKLSGEIPECIFSKITSLNVSNNALNKFPNVITKLINLDTLDISDNKIKKIPLEMFKLTNLTKLYVDNNKLTTLSKNIENLTELKILYISYNNIKKIPDEICKLPKLIELSIENTYISEIPDIDTLKVLIINNEKLVKISDNLKQKNNLYIFKTML